MQRPGMRTVAVLVSLLALVATGCGWIRYRGDTRHTGTNPAEHGIGLGNLETLQTSWTTGDRHFWFEPLIAGGRVFVATRVSIYAFDATNGTRFLVKTGFGAALRRLAPAT